MPTTAELQSSAHAMIVSWGGGVDNGLLIRQSGSRAATMAIMDYTPTERNTFQVDGLTKIRISKIGLTIDPNALMDQIEFGGETYAIMQKPRGPKPQGVAIYWDCDCAVISPS